MNRRVTKTNWLFLTRREMLERQTLFPDGGEVGRLTRKNWLGKLRKWVLENQLLYPSAPDVGLLTNINWLWKLRKDFMERDDLFPAGGLAGFLALIKRAQAILSETKRSHYDDGSDIPKNQLWAPQWAIDSFTTAIERDAMANKDFLEMHGDEVSQERFDEVVDISINSLREAINEFLSNRQRGTLSSTVPFFPPWEITYTQPSQVTMNRVFIPMGSFVGFGSHMLDIMNIPNVGVYKDDWTPTGNVKLLAMYTLSPPDTWLEVSLDEVFSPRPTNRLTMWEWDTDAVRITGSNSTGQPVQLRLVFSGTGG